jgi:hypothetical protein
VLLRTRFFVLGLSLLVLIVVINLLRTRKLKEEYAILWLIAGGMLVLLPLFVDAVDAVSYAIGIEYPPALIFLLALIGVILILVQYSITISRFSDQIKMLTQEIALLRQRLRELESKQPDQVEAADAAKR